MSRRALKRTVKEEDCSFDSECVKPAAVTEEEGCQRDTSNTEIPFPSGDIMM
jgi:hypothetical protein